MNDLSKLTTWSQNVPPVKLTSELAPPWLPFRRRSAISQTDEHAGQTPSSPSKTPTQAGLPASAPITPGGNECAQSAKGNLNSNVVLPSGGAQPEQPTPDPMAMAAITTAITGAGIHPLYEEYNRIAYHAKINLLEIQARDYRLGLLLLATQELADERNFHFKVQEQILSDVGLVVQQMERLGLNTQERLQEIHKMIDEYVGVHGQRQGQGTRSGPGIAMTSSGVAVSVASTRMVHAPYQERYSGDSKVVVDIPLAKMVSDSNMSVEDVQRVGRAFVEAPAVSLKNHIRNVTRR